MIHMETSTDTKYVPMPRGWRESTIGHIACPHRDLTVCGDCANAHPEAVDVDGMYYWMGSKAERDEWEITKAEVEAEYA